MKLVNKVLYTVTGVTLCAYKIHHAYFYLDFLSNTLKYHLCESYNVIVYVAKIRCDLVNPDKTRHSRKNWNDILKAVPYRSSFDRIVKMLELNT